MEDHLFIDDFPVKTSNYSEYSMAMLDNQMVIYKTVTMTDQFCLMFRHSNSGFVSEDMRHKPVHKRNEKYWKPLNGFMCFISVSSNIPRDIQTSIASLFRYSKTQILGINIAHTLW